MYKIETRSFFAILIALLAPAPGIAQPPSDDLIACQSDDHCVIVRNDCGDRVGNKKYASQLVVEPYCLKSGPYFPINAVAKCVNGQCSVLTPVPQLPRDVDSDAAAEKTACEERTGKRCAFDLCQIGIAQPLPSPACTPGWKPVD